MNFWVAEVARLQNSPRKLNSGEFSYQFFHSLSATRFESRSDSATLLSAWTIYFFSATGAVAGAEALPFAGVGLGTGSGLDPISGELAVMRLLVGA